MTTKMMKIGLLFLVALLSTGGQAQETDADVTELVTKNMEFMMSLYREIAGSSDDNVFVSPLSVSSALAALSAGAQGATREQTLRGLGLDPLNADRIPELFQKLQGEVKLDQAAAIFARQQAVVETPFAEQIKTYFGVDVGKADFTNAQASQSAISDYIKSKMGGKVREAVGTMDPQTVLALVSAAFFQGNWELPFSANYTQEERFFVSKYKIVQVPMMFRDDRFYLAYDPEVKAGVLKLPYQAGAAMLVILPDKDVDYTSVDEVLTAQRFLGWVKKLKKTKLEVQLPRFSLDQTYSLGKVLPTLAISNVLESTADLSGVSKEPGLRLSEVLHKAAIQVKETGNMAGPTGSQFGGSTPPRLSINRPFLFVIYHEATGCPLFAGRVVDPSKM
ncbi:hypothetical protein AGOR_G00088420 [Albula goreensis]|uniref:Serpin domain-containing protein n=1 Tax=Albula goreensis TaxID=1534307 RepID=A0A8T3DPN7_9TELE|nr:hypothetical protein AGOR_G00088420 [Albula goreensis]